MRSAITRVPAVTAERSPPASRMTGADSPVIAASFTEATPSTTSPSAGMRSPVSTSTISPTSRRLAPTSSQVSPTLVSSLARSSALVARRLAACALPRPSASASAKLPNRTVSHSQKTSCPSNTGLPPDPARLRTNNSVESAATNAVTNITGLRISVRGSSLTKASRIAGTISSAVKMLCVAMMAFLRAECRPRPGNGRRRGRGRGSAER